MTSSQGSVPQARVASSPNTSQPVFIFSSILLFSIASRMKVTFLNTRIACLSPPRALSFLLSFMRAISLALFFIRTVGWPWRSLPFPSSSSSSTGYAASRMLRGEPPAQWFAGSEEVRMFTGTLNTRSTYPSSSPPPLPVHVTSLTGKWSVGKTA